MVSDANGREGLVECQIGNGKHENAQKLYN